MAPEISINDYLVRGWGRMTGVCDRCGGHDWRGGGDTNHCDDCQVGLVWDDQYSQGWIGSTKMLCVGCLASELHISQDVLKRTRKYSHFGE